MRIIGTYKGRPLYGNEDGELWMTTFRLLMVRSSGKSRQVAQFYDKETAEAALERRKSKNKDPRIDWQLWECPPGWPATAQ